MAHAEGVELTLCPLGEARQAALAADGVHAVATACENLVGIGLMADVPHQTVFRRVEYVMQSDRQFQNPQPGTEVPTGLADGPEQERAQLPGQLGQLFRMQLAELDRGVNPVQQRRVRLLGRDFLKRIWFVHLLVSLSGVSEYGTYYKGWVRLISCL